VPLVVLQFLPVQLLGGVLSEIYLVQELMGEDFDICDK